MSTRQPSAEPRSRLHLIYYALATFDVVAVLLSLYLITLIVNMYGDSVDRNAGWADRLGDYADLSRHADAVNAPGNDAFLSPGRADDHEESRRSALAAFEAKAGVVRQELAEYGSVEMRERFDLVLKRMQEMTVEANDVFAQLRDGRTDLAGEHMAAMDQRHTELSHLLKEIGDEARVRQQEALFDQARQAGALGEYVLVIVVLIVLMVVGVTFYGHTLSQQMKRAALRTTEHVRQLGESEARLEQAVAARTSELKASYEQLELAERMASIGTLAAGLGHDMNNVLFPVRCRLQALADGDLTDDVCDDEVAAINRSVDYLLQLSEGLRLLALDPEDGQVTDGRTSIPKWWGEVAPLFRTALPKGSRLEAELPDGLPEIAVAPHRLTQAVFNLLVNAGEAMEREGCARVWADTLDGMVRIGVTDNGHGMPDDVRQHALDPFFTTKKRGLSTGLGLALVHGVATAAGGRVDIESAEGRGTTVSLELPAADENAGDDGHVRSAVVAVADRRQASFLSSLLRSAGCETRAEVQTSDPPDADVWVVEAAAATEDHIRVFLDSSPRRRMIVLGDVPATDGVIAVDPAAGMGAIRAAIGAALNDKVDTA